MFEISVPDSIKIQINENGVSKELYDNYRKKYNYRSLFQPYDEVDVIETQVNKY